VEDNDLKRRYLTRTGASAALIIVFTAFSAAWAPIVTSATAQEVIRRVPAPRWSLFDIFTPRRERVRPKVDAPEAPRANRQKPAATAAKPRKPKSRVVAKTTETTVGLATAANASAAAATETLPERSL
jgi:hypothetical protein